MIAWDGKTGCYLFLMGFLLSILCSGPGVAKENQKRSKTDTSLSAEKKETIESLISRLDAKFLQARKSARKKLVEIGSPAVPFLMEAYENGTYRKRKNSLLALAEIGDEQSVPVLIQAYFHQSDLRLTARKGLVRIGPEALNQLRAYAEEHPQKADRVDEFINHYVRVRVERTLINEITKLGGVGFYDGQFKELTDIKEHAPSVLKEIAMEDYQFTIDVPSYVKRKLKQARRFGYLDPIKRMALEAIGVVGTKEDIPFLKKITGEKPGYRGREKPAAIALYRLGVKEPLQYLRDRLKNRYTSSRQVSQLRKYGLEYTSILTRLNEMEKAIPVYKHILDKLKDGKGYNRDILWYNLACSYAQTGKTDKAIKALQNAVQEGYTDYKWVEIDGDMDPLRDMKEFQSIKKNMKQQEQETVKTKTGGSSEQED